MYVSIKWLCVACFVSVSIVMPGRFAAGQDIFLPEFGADVCHDFETRINWVLGPETARQRAEKESKLLLVMHLSGNFAKSAFT